MENAARPKLTTRYERFETPGGFDVVQRVWVLTTARGSETLTIHRGVTPTQAKCLALMRCGQIPEVL